MKTFKNILLLLFCLLILLPLYPIFWLARDGKGVSDKEYEKMKKEADDSIYGLITFF